MDSQNPHHHHSQPPPQPVMVPLHPPPPPATASHALFSASPGSGFSGHQKKRGRPRKYAHDGGGSSIGLGLTPTHPATVPVAVRVSSPPDGVVVEARSDEGPLKKCRGRPAGSQKKQLDALGGAGGTGFTPHVILVEAGEDIASTVRAFSQEGPRGICILSAFGPVSKAAICQPAVPGHTVIYEGQYDMINLSGNFQSSGNNFDSSKPDGLTVLLAGPDGRVMGGEVAGELVAAAQVQIIAASFIPDGKRNATSRVTTDAAPASQVLNFNVAPTANSPSSRDNSSDSSNDHGSHSLTRGSELFGNASQRIQSLEMYPIWAGQTRQ